MSYLLLVPAGAAMLAAMYAIYQRPQRGLLLAALLVPFHGLLLIVPNGDSFLWWKEALLALTLLATFVTPNRKTGAGVSLPWMPAAVLFVVIGCLSALLVFGIPSAVYPVKITFFYLIVITFILWRTPLTFRDRDQLVTIVMVVSVLTACWGLIQQYLGAAFLADLGYEYNVVIRTAGSFLRSFSTFTQPFAFGLYIMMALVLGISVALQDPARLRNRLFLLMTPVLLVGMGVSIVRAAYLGAVFGLLWLTVHRYRRLLMGLAATALVGAMSLLYVPTKVLDSVFSSSSLGQRTTGWSQVGTRVMTHPFGEGLGSTGSAADKLASISGINDDYLWLLQKLNPALTYQPDNYYVKIVLELGQIGLFAFLLLILSIVITTLRASRYTTGVDSAFCLGVSAAVVAACAASMFSTYFEIFPLDFYFWLLVGAVGCAMAQRRTKASGDGSLVRSSAADAMMSSVR